MFVIWSWHHRQWWGPNHEGYTSSLAKAGRYTPQEAGGIHVNSGLPGRNTAVDEVGAKNHLDSGDSTVVEDTLDSLRRL